MNSYDLSRKFIDFSFENPSKIKPNHYALYFFAIEHCNRLGWKKEYGLPTTMTMEAIGIKSYNTYIKTFNELIDFGFFKLVERSKNQYSSNIIELSNFDKALNKALDKAFIKHASKQSKSTEQSIDSIIKQINNKQIKQETILLLKKSIDLYLEKETQISDTINNKIFLLQGLKDKQWLDVVSMQNKTNIDVVKSYLYKFENHLISTKKQHTNYKDFASHYGYWLNTNKPKPIKKQKIAF